MSHYKRELLRTFALSVVAFLVLALLTIVVHMFVPAEYVDWVLAPAFILWGVLFVGGCWGFGPIGRRLRKATQADKEREEKKIHT